MEQVDRGPAKAFVPPAPVTHSLALRPTLGLNSQDASNHLRLDRPRHRRGSIHRTVSATSSTSQAALEARSEAEVAVDSQGRMATVFASQEESGAYAVRRGASSSSLHRRGEVDRALSRRWGTLDQSSAARSDLRSIYSMARPRSASSEVERGALAAAGRSVYSSGTREDVRGVEGTMGQRSQCRTAKEEAGRAGSSEYCKGPSTFPRGLARSQAHPRDTGETAPGSSRSSTNTRGDRSAHKTKRSNHCTEGSQEAGARGSQASAHRWMVLSPQAASESHSRSRHPQAAPCYVGGNQGQNPRSPCSPGSDDSRSACQTVRSTTARMGRRLTEQRSPSRAGSSHRVESSRRLARATSFRRLHRKDVAGEKKGAEDLTVFTSDPMEV